MRKKISGAADYIVPIGLIGIVAFALYKMGIFSGTFSGSGANNQGTTDANASAASQAAAQAAAQGIKATLSPNEAASIANSVYSLGVNASDTSALSQITNLLSQVNNIADLNAIIAAFGTKKIPSGDITAWYNTCLSLGVNCTSVGLGTFIDSVYQAYDPSGGYLSNLNQFLQDQGINYSF
jgi:hypothetical protein